MPIANDVKLSAVGARMRAAAQRSGKTKRAIAEEMNTSEDALNNYFKGDRSIQLDRFIKFCIAVEASPLWIMFDIGNIRLPNPGLSREERISDLAAQILSLTHSNDDGTVTQS